MALYNLDITMLYHAHRRDMWPLLEAVRPFVAPDMYDELEMTVRDIQARVARIDAARSSN